MINNKMWFFVLFLGASKARSEILLRASHDDLLSSPSAVDAPIASNSSSGSNNNQEEQTNGRQQQQQGGKDDSQSNKSQDSGIDYIEKPGEMDKKEIDRLWPRWDIMKLWHDQKRGEIVKGVCTQLHGPTLSAER